MYEGQQIYGRWGGGPLKRESVAEPRKHTPPHVCYLTKFRRSSSNRLGVGSVPNKFGDAKTRSLLSRI